MFRNAESHFANIPDIKIERSKMTISNGHLTTFNVGELIPIYWSEILPGDTVSMNVSKVLRLQTLLTPPFGNMVCDVGFWFIPNRLCDEKWQNVMLENTDSAWAPTTQYGVPHISSPSGGFATGTIADYLGCPVGVEWAATDKNAPYAYPFRAYALVANEFWRDENLTDPINIPKSNSNQTGVNTAATGYIDECANGGLPFKVSKLHDYFTSCLPSAQKAAEPVTFPLLSGGSAPVHALFQTIPADMRNGNALKWYRADNQEILTNLSTSKVVGVASATGNTNYGYVNYPSGQTVPNTPLTMEHTIAPANLWADLSSSVGAVTVNELRLAFQLQRFYERQARSGSRYVETIRSFFGVTSPDARLQRPEYLGGNRVPIIIDEVTNTSEGSSGSEIQLGNLAGKSNTSDSNFIFEHSFTEHGILMGFVCVRYTHSYSDGMPKPFLKDTFTSFYWPTFAHLGEMPVPKACIYASGNMDSDSVFGYQEAYAEYRFRPDMVSGLMRPKVTTGKQTLAYWNFADDYRTDPTLSDEWIREDKNNVDRTLAVTSELSNQILADFYFDAVYTRPMPVYSVPGLIDHF